MFELSNIAFNAPAAAASQKAASLAFVDLSAEPAKAQIVRKGYDVPQVELDTKKVDQFIGQLAQLPITAVPRVVSQTIQPGTKVPAGTVVDLVLAPRNKIPFEVFAGVHADLAAKNLDALDPLLADAAAQKTLLTYSDPTQVPVAERTHLQAALLTVGVTVDETDVNKTFSKAFTAARGALAFQG